MTFNAVDIQNLSKEYKTDFWKKKVVALRDVSFGVEPGCVFGLVGPNGAGKTTTIKILVGLMKPTKGSARVFGLEVSDVHAKKNMGYLPENAYYYDFLCPYEILDFYGRLFGYSKKQRENKIDNLLEVVGLQHKKHVLLKGFSKGMLQRIGLAQALINDPQLVILDEPMSGLDPVGRKDVRNIILQLKKQGKTVLFSSHILSDVETLCDQVGMMIDGKLTSHGNIVNLLNPRTKSTEIIFKTDKNKNPEIDLPGTEIQRIGDELVVTLLDPSKVPSVIDWGRSHHLLLMSVSSQKESLEDIFVQHVRNHL